MSFMSSRFRSDCSSPLRRKAVLRLDGSSPANFSFIAFRKSFWDLSIFAMSYASFGMKPYFTLSEWMRVI
jgi:hypothetical protein